MSIASIGGIDHAVILVRDLDSARHRFARLGFTVSPRGRHSEHVGTANHTIMLREDYVELMGVLRPTEANARWRDALAAREGLDTVALRTRSAARTASELVALGFPASAPLHFSRPIGNGKEAAFNLALFPPAATPQLNVFACEHLTRENVWLPELMEHANGAVAVASVTIVTGDTAGLVAAYERLFGPSRVKTTDEGVTVDSGSASIRFVTRAGFAALYPGIAVVEAAMPYPAAVGLRVSDLAATRRALVGLSTVERGAAICVRPEEACGALIEFSE
jgi:hypothetical protein